MKHRNNNADARKLRDLMKAVTAIDSVEDCRRFFIDLCTPAELQSLSDRWQVAQLLDQGVPYRQIYEQTGVSTATVTRVARALAHGEDGYRRVLDQTAAHSAVDPVPQPVTKPVTKPTTKSTSKPATDRPRARAAERSRSTKRVRR